MEGEPLDEVQWRAPEWIQMSNGLRTDNVLEYFAQSPFYDRSSNNQVLKMQTQFVDNFQGRQDLYKELQNMKGIEFVIALEREPEMWIIRKQNRLSPHEVRVLVTYFVVNENIFMAPSVYSVVSSRLLSTSQKLIEALAKATTLPTFSPSQGYSYVNETGITVGDESNAATAVPGSTPVHTPAVKDKSAAATPASPANLPAHAAPHVPSSGEERTIERVMDRTLSYTLANTTSYIDTSEVSVFIKPPVIAADSKAKPPPRRRRKEK